MLTAAVAFGCAVAASAALTPAVRKLAFRVGAVDNAAVSSRKVHIKPIPRMGGLAIVIAFFVPVAALFFVTTGMAQDIVHDPRLTIALFLGGGAIAALGLYDDVRGSDARLKFTVQFGVAAFAYALGLRIVQIDNPFGSAISLGPLAFPFTLFFIVGVTNAINLIDGLDGLAGGIVFTAVLTCFVAAALRGDTMMMVITAALAGAVLGFLFYNFNPASIFMGDTGSMFLGYILSVAAIRSHQKAHDVVAITVPLIALALPIVDTLLALLRRAARGMPLFRGDKEHIHHKLLARGLSHRRAVLTLYAATLVLGLAAVLFAALTGVAAASVVVAVGIVGVVLLRRLDYLRVERTVHMLSARRKHLDLRRTIDTFSRELREVRRVEDVWAAIHRAMPHFDAKWARLELVLESAGRRQTIELTDGAKPDAKLGRTKHPLLTERLERGFLELGWAEDRLPLPREVELVIETLCANILKVLEELVEQGAGSRRVIELPARDARPKTPPVVAAARPKTPVPLSRPRLVSSGVDSSHSSLSRYAPLHNVGSTALDRESD